MRKKSDQDLIIADKSISEKIKTLSTSPVKIFALGGLGEVGKNIYCIEDEKGILVIDCGVMFPDDTLPGVNYVIPDFSYLQQNQDKIRALVITHGHEDHIGSIPFFLQLINLPVIYAPKLAASLIRHKVQDFKLTERAKIIEYDGDSVLNVGDFVVSFYHVTHSIPDCYGIVIDTPHGRIVESGDFKIDLTPIDRDFDIAKLAMIGEKGVDLYLGESTNAEKEGYTPSEKSVINSILESFQIAKGRLIISTFASNISRICQIVQATLKFDRKLVIIGRSMETNINIAREYGYIKIPDSSIIDINEINKFRKNEIVILCTGSQGENLAALSRIAKNEHKYVHIIPGDTIVFSSSPIPGNTQSINSLINLLVRQGGNVLVHDGIFNLHASGHASRLELRLALKLIKPKYFCPIHGEYRMLKLHAEMAVDEGVKKENTFVIGNGDVLTLFNHTVSVSDEHVQADALYIDGTDAVGLSTSIIKDRNILANEGMVAIFVLLDAVNNKILFNPIIQARGFMTINKTYLQYKLQENIYNSLTKLLASPKVTYQQIKETIKSEASRYFYRETRRNPMIIPVILSKDKNTEIAPVKNTKSNSVAKEVNIMKVDEDEI